MKCRENESTSQGTRVYRGKVTFRYKKYCPAITVGLQGISDELVTTYLMRFVVIRTHPKALKHGFRQPPAFANTFVSGCLVSSQLSLPEALSATRWEKIIYINPSVISPVFRLFV